MANLSRTACVLLIASSLVVVGCATPGAGGSRSSDSDPCNILVGAVIGALGGALLDRDKAARGAAIGAAAGALACVAINAVSRQTRTAKEVEEDYRKTNAGQLPVNEPIVQSYDVMLKPGSSVQSGEKLQLVSNMTVVSAANQPVNEVKEILTVVSPDGSNRTSEKKANEKPGSGSYENTFNVTLPKGVAPGAYPVKTQLYINGKQLAERQQELRIMADAGGLRIALVQPVPR